MVSKIDPKYLLALSFNNDLLVSFFFSLSMSNETGCRYRILSENKRNNKPTTNSLILPTDRTKNFRNFYIFLFLSRNLVLSMQFVVAVTNDNNRSINLKSQSTLSLFFDHSLAHPHSFSSATILTLFHSMHFKHTIISINSK